MAFIQASRFSKTLGMDTEFNICLPQSAFDDAEISPDGIIYLLHGAQGNCSDWLRKTRAESYAVSRNIALVCVSGFLSGYQNMDFGFDMYSYIVDELIPYIEKAFPLNATRERRMIAGLSMGGRGALLIGLKRPDLFSKIAAFSCAIDMPTKMIPWELIGLGNSEFDIRRIIENNVSKKINMPSIYMEIGLQDEFLPFARETRDFIRAKASGAIKLKYSEKNGSHNWDFWDRAILNFISSLKLDVRTGIF